MNDFTKDELQIIHLDMTTYINITPMLKESPIHKELRDKIKSMIDNYCEHHFISGCGVCSGFLEIDCVNCGISANKPKVILTDNFTKEVKT